MRISRYDDINLRAQEVSGEPGKTLGPAFGETPFDDEISALDIAKLAHALRESAPLTRLQSDRARSASEKSDAPDLARPLTPRSDRPRRLVRP